METVIRKEDMSKNYSIVKCSKANVINADWSKPFWQNIEPLEICLSHWSVQLEHFPRTEVKLQYTADRLYVIFRVKDCYVRSVTSEINGDVWKDACVEFFFSPNIENPNAYFNLETNCCGALLAQYHTGPRENSRCLDMKDCLEIEIASSASGPIRNEIIKPLTWTLEYVIPFEILTHYTDFNRPQTGVTWYANFYKCADACSHPHWITWSPIRQIERDFHQPAFFGKLNFM